MKKAQKLEKINNNLFTEITSPKVRIAGGYPTFLEAVTGPDTPDFIED